MKFFSACRISAIAAALCCFSDTTAALLLRNQTKQIEQKHTAETNTGLLCREPGGTADLDVVLEEGGWRSLLFSTVVKGKNGTVLGHNVAGMQSTVHCGSDVVAKEKCLPADLSKPVPTCSEVGKSGRCPCASGGADTLKLPYQQAMVSEALTLCQAKARSKQTFRVLMFGLGGGAMPMYLRHRCDAADIEIVENNEHVALIAQRLMGFKADEHNRVEIADGEQAATRRSSTNVWPEGPHYDLVLVDCFDGDNHVAASCRSTSFVTALHNILKPDSQVLQNMMEADEKQVMPMYYATFGEGALQKRVVQKGQFLVVAKTHPTHPSAPSHAA